MEITRFLRPGPNKLVLAATKRVQEERASVSPEVALNVVVGEGNVGGDHVMIDTPLVEARRTAAEVPSWAFQPGPARAPLSQAM